MVPEDLEDLDSEPSGSCVDDRKNSGNVPDGYLGACILNQAYVSDGSCYGEESCAANFAGEFLSLVLWSFRCDSLFWLLSLSLFAKKSVWTVVTRMVHASKTKAL